MIGLFVNFSTLPVPSQVQKDWADAVDAVRLSAAKVIRSFFMFVSCDWIHREDCRMH